jgi:hypothetical protein
MNSMRQIDTRQEQRNYWADQLTYYRNLLRAHATGFELAKFATAVLDNILKDMAPQDADQGHTNEHTIQELCSDKETLRGNQDADALISQSTESARSFDVVASNLMTLHDIDFEIDWLESSSFRWSVENLM